MRKTSKNHPFVVAGAAILTVSIAAVGCSSSDGAASTTSPSVSSTTGTTMAASTAPAEAPAVGRFASPNPGSVNTFWLTVPGGLIVVDAGRNVSGGTLAAAQIASTGKAVVAIVITHPHPDHVGGLGPLHAAFPDAPIYASEATAELMRSDPLGFYPLARQSDPDYPAELTYPDRMFVPGASLDLGGARVETAQFDNGESRTATVYYDPASGALFGGDLTDDMATPALLEGHTCGWLTNLDSFEGAFPDAATIYPGHGAPGDPTAQIDAQRTYLQVFRGLVTTAIEAASPAGAAVDAGEQAAIVTELDRRYPGYPPVASLPDLQAVNVMAVAEELSAAVAGDLPPACQG